MLHLLRRSSGCNPISAGASGTLPPDSPSHPSPSRPAASATFGDLPGHIVLQVADGLPDTAMVALGLTCKHAYQSLDRDCLVSIRLRERAQWVTSHAAFVHLLERMAPCPRQWRVRLWHDMREAVDSLHPKLRRAALRSLEESHRADMEWLAARTQESSGPSLDRVLALPAAQRDRSLAAWIRKHSGYDTVREMMAMGPNTWIEIVRGLPAQGQVHVHEALVETWRDTDVESWRAILDATLELARGLDGSPDPLDQANRARLLIAVADAVTGHGEPIEESAVYRRALWQRLLAEVPRLPAPHNKALMRALARASRCWCDLGATLDDMDDMDDMDVDVSDRWPALIDCAFAHLPPTDVADVLCDMLVPGTYINDEPLFVPRTKDVVQACRKLPDNLALEVIRRAFHQRICTWDWTSYAFLWDALMDASRTAPQAIEAQSLTLLGPFVHATGDGREARFSAFCDRLEALPPALQRRPLLALGAPAPEIFDVPGDSCLPADTVVPRLTGLAANLHEEDRAALLATMIPSFSHEPRWRAFLVNMAAGLAEPYRFKPLKALARDLRRRAGDTAVAPTTSLHIGASAHDYGIAMWPTNWSAVRKQLSAVLAMLPLRHRGDLLLEHARHASHAAEMEWILDEAEHLPRTHRHEVKLVTRIAKFAANRCAAEDAPKLLPKLATAISTLEADHCASAFYWLVQACDKFAMPECVGMANTLDRLPEADRVIPASDNKRNATSQPSNT